MTNKHIPPAVGEFAVGERDQLLARIAEQAREIERLRLNIAEYNEHERCYQSELAALKAQPSGLVLPDPKKEIVAWGHNKRKYDEGYADGWNDALDEVARLNSSTVSAGDDAQYPPCDYCAEPLSYHPWHGSGLINGVESRHIHACDKCRHLLPVVSAGGVDERAAFEAWYLGHFYMGDKQCGLEWLSTEPCGGYRHQHPAEQWIVWQARAALSAPSHGEQVRECSLSRESLTLAYRLITKDLETLANGSAIDRFKSAQDEFRSAIAAAPSPASQEQGE